MFPKVPAKGFPQRTAAKFIYTPLPSISYIRYITYIIYINFIYIFVSISINVIYTIYSIYICETTGCNTDLFA